MQNATAQLKSSEKLLEPMTTRVPVDVKLIVDDLADGNRAKWIREAIELKIEVDLGQSLSEAKKKSKNTMNSSEYMNLFKSLFSVFQISKKPDVRDRALSSVH
ncbi:hypothetical protein EC846_1522 [Acinetobacter sp. BIGb0102]|uniref:hypothetical protein n=1 Tax=Acinetobacter sp. BIGb0102 TaxID=2485131 RepID=UPI000F4DB8C7|nr:hypothetical protein [Acinetobacter sp. BIGb0102]RPE30821.1 hypothetical protein EC846_1522 [Acinetobacter sp. BIGb0102]